MFGGCFCGGDTSRPVLLSLSDYLIESSVLSAPYKEFILNILARLSGDLFFFGIGGFTNFFLTWVDA